MNILISGGAKNGKSTLAQRMAKEEADRDGRELYYVATMIAEDDEDRQRIARHIANREGWGFTTVERPGDLWGLLGETCDPRGVFLVDSVTAVLANQMFHDGIIDEEAVAVVEKDLCDFALATGNTIFVSDNIYSDAAVFDDTVEAYREGLGKIDRALARICQTVIEVSAGQITCHKGMLALK